MAAFHGSGPLLDRIALGIDIGHDRVEQPACGEDDEVVDDRHGSSRAKIELSQRQFHQIDGKNGG